MLLITAVGVRGASLERLSFGVAALSCWSPEDADGALLGAVLGCAGGVAGFSWTCKKRPLPLLYHDTGSPLHAVQANAYPKIAASAAWYSTT